MLQISFSSLVKERPFRGQTSVLGKAGSGVGNLFLAIDSVLDWSLGEEARVLVKNLYEPKAETP